MLTSHQQQAKTQLIATIVTVLVIAGLVVLVDQLRVDKTETASRPSPNTSLNEPITPATATPSAPDTASNAGSIKDGTYSATGSYFVPPGEETIEVTLTLKDEIVIDSSVVHSEGDRTSKVYHDAFTEGYKSTIVGKKITGLQVGAIAGASDTADGFNEALAQIISKAKS